MIVRSIDPSALVKVTDSVSPADAPAGGAPATNKLSRTAEMLPVTLPLNVTSILTGGAGVAPPAVPAVRPEPSTNDVA